MRPFFSHSSKQKALVKRLVHYLPKGIQPWIDEYDMPAGASVHLSLQQAVARGTDHFVLFLSSEATQSEWVSREVDWALKRERDENRIMILQVVLDDSEVGLWDSPALSALKNRHYLKLFNQDDLQLQVLSQQLADNLYELLESRLNNSSLFSPLPSMQANLWRDRRSISSQEWRKIFGDATTRIWLLGYAMRRSVARDETGPLIADRIAHGVDVRIIVLDPLDPSNQQIPEVGRLLQQTDLRSKILDTLRLAWEVEGHAKRIWHLDNPSVHSLFEDPLLSIGVTDLTIHNSIVIVDERALITVYSHQFEMGDAGATLEIEENGPEGSVFRFFEYEFLVHWRRSRVYLDTNDQPIRPEMRVVPHKKLADVSYRWYQGISKELTPPHLAVIYPTYRCKHGP
jgi:hypothetical protein